MSWNDDQWLAIRTDGNVIVSAAAGAGKTSVLTERVLRLVQSGTSIDRMLILTFTRAAASEMKTRIAARLDDMFVAGLEEEKRRLKALYPVWSKTAALAIGYREGDDRQKIFIRTCQLAKRQDTWFRHQASALYVEPTVEAVRACWQTHGPWAVEFPRPSTVGGVRVRRPTDSQL